MAYEIRLPTVYRQTGPMNCWFYATKTIVYCLTRRVLLEADYLGMSSPTAAAVEIGRGAGAPSWLLHGLPPGSIDDFAEQFRFDEPSSRPAQWTAPVLERALRTHGPLWFGGHNGSFNHVVVVNGVTDGSFGVDEGIIYGDPATGGRATATMDQFNAWKRQQLGLRNPLYYKGG
jgi:hypothetical protein